MSIRTKEQLFIALDMGRRLESKRKLNNGEAMYLDALLDLLSACHNVYFDSLPGSNADFLFCMMAETKTDPARLHRHTGISILFIWEVLAGQRKFDPAMVVKLTEYFRLPSRVFNSSE